MKNMKETTAWHYNLYSSNMEALSLAMMIRDSFEVGGQIEELTESITKSALPTKENIISWLIFQRKKLSRFRKTVKYLHFAGINFRG